MASRHVPLFSLWNTIACRKSVKMYFSPQRIHNALPTKDKSISRQMVLKDAGAVCLRWEASGGRRATVKWNTRLSDSPDVAHKGDAHLPRCQTHGTAKWAFAGNRKKNCGGERERWVGEEEWIFHIGIKLNRILAFLQKSPQVMLKRCRDHTFLCH